MIFWLFDGPALSAKRQHGANDARGAAGEFAGLCLCQMFVAYF